MRGKAKAALPHFVELGEKKSSDLLRILDKYHLLSEKIMLLSDENTATIGGNGMLDMLRSERLTVVSHSVDNSDDQNVARIAKTIAENQPQTVIGFGGGKVLDVSKLAAGLNNTKYVSIPTTLSNDGIASPVAVIKNRQNIPISHITATPYGVIIDLSIVRSAPRRHLMAGVGDLVSNLSAVFDARLAHAKRAEEIEQGALELAEAGGKKLIQLEALEIEDSAFLQELAHGLVKSGFAMCIWGTSRPASGSEHKISHSIDHYFPPSRGLHGEQVGIAALFTMALQENPWLNPVRHFYEKVGFPSTLSHLSLKANDFLRVVTNATRIRPERYTILEDKNPGANEILRIIDSLKL